MGVLELASANRGAKPAMCYQCFGCGKCAGVNPDPNVNMCPLCHRIVEDGVRWCPYCGAYIRPKTGSLAAKRKRARAHASEPAPDAQVDAQTEDAAASAKPPEVPSAASS